MSTDRTTPAPTGASVQSDPAEIEARIEATRADLAATIDTLGAKVDVRSRVRRRWRDAVEGATDGQGRPTPRAEATVAAAVAVGCGVAAVVVWRHHG